MTSVTIGVCDSGFPLISVSVSGATQTFVLLSGADAADAQIDKSKIVVAKVMQREIILFDNVIFCQLLFVKYCIRELSNALSSALESPFHIKPAATKYITSANYTLSTRTSSNAFAPPIRIIKCCGILQLVRFSRFGIVVTACHAVRGRAGI